MTAKWRFNILLVLDFLLGQFCLAHFVLLTVRNSY